MYAFKLVWFAIYMLYFFNVHGQGVHLCTSRFTFVQIGLVYVITRVSLHVKLCSVNTVEMLWYLIKYSFTYTGIFYDNLVTQTS